MRTPASLFSLMLSIAIAHAQQVQFRQLPFDELIDGRHTQNEKGQPMALLAALEFKPDSLLCLGEVMDILFPVPRTINSKTAVVYRWDEGKRGWEKLGASLRPKKIGSHAYYKTQLQCRGVYALMQELDIRGETKIRFPRGYSADTLFWYQDNLHAAARIPVEKGAKGVSLPLECLSAVANIEGRFKDAQGNIFQLKTKAGNLRRKPFLWFLPEPQGLVIGPDQLHPMASPLLLSTLK
ncbi:MAG: hypothetical protein O3C32_08750 [Bacteroidetes bacterium]|nr:hypothetical protein [Bacteroidota bacterium]